MKHHSELRYGKPPKPHIYYSRAHGVWALNPGPSTDGRHNYLFEGVRRNLAAHNFCRKLMGRT